jgi:hypothetical protein
MLINAMMFTKMNALRFMKNLVKVTIVRMSQDKNATRCPPSNAIAFLSSIVKMFQNVHVRLFLHKNVVPLPSSNASRFQLLRPTMSVVRSMFQSVAVYLENSA